MMMMMIANRAVISRIIHTSTKAFQQELSEPTILSWRTDFGSLSPLSLSLASPSLSFSFSVSLCLSVCLSHFLIVTGCAYNWADVVGGKRTVSSAVHCQHGNWNPTKERSVDIKDGRWAFRVRSSSLQRSRNPFGSRRGIVAGVRRFPASNCSSVMQQQTSTCAGLRWLSHGNPFDLKKKTLGTFAIYIHFAVSHLLL